MKLATALVLLAALLLLMLGVPVAASLILDNTGAAATGTVTEKVERIREKYTRPSRKLEVTLRYRAADIPADTSSTIEVDEDTYDSLVIGMRVPLRYQTSRLLRSLEPWAPATRLEGQSTWDWIRASVSGDTVRVLFTILGGLPLFILGAKKRRWYFGLLLLYLSLVAVYWLTPVAERAPSGATQTTVARVRYIHRIEKILTTERGSSRSSLTLIRPMELVELEFVPVGKTEPVVATDKITAGSLTGLKQGGTVEVTYQISRPRIARMHGGSRDYAWTNLATVALPWMIGLIFFFGGSVLLAFLLAAVGTIIQRRRRRA